MCPCDSASIMSPSHTLRLPCSHVQLFTRSIMQHTIMAMNRVGIPEADQEAIFRTVAAILHLGNVSFKGGEEESSLPAGPEAEVELAAAGGPCTHAYTAVAGASGLGQHWA